MSNVLELPVRRKSNQGRRNAVQGLPLADILSFERAQRMPTVEEKCADYEAAFDEIARGLLMAIREITALSRKYPESRV